MAFRVVDIPIRAWNACATSKVGLISIYSSVALVANAYGLSIAILSLPDSVNHSVWLAPITSPSGRLALVGMA